MTQPVFKGVKLTQEQVTYIQRLADLKYEGNFSMALRSILADVMASKL